MRGRVLAALLSLPEEVGGGWCSGGGSEAVAFFRSSCAGLQGVRLQGVLLWGGVLLGGVVWFLPPRVSLGEAVAQVKR